MTTLHAQESILIVTAARGVAACAQQMARELGCTVDLAPGRREAQGALRRREYCLLILDETLALAEAEQAEQLITEAGAAYPLQLNFAVTGPDRVLREARAALRRRRTELARATQAGSRVLEAELSSSLTGILLELDLLQSSPRLPEEERLRIGHVMELTQNVRRRLSRPDSPQTRPAEAAWKSLPLGTPARLV